MTTSPADLLTQPVLDHMAALLDVQGVAQSARLLIPPCLSSLRRRPYAGAVKLGALVRWSRQAVLDWIANGCKPCRPAGRG